ncbi:MAG: ABC transporter permease [Lachnospiraceae bacterium]|nr:ABC transporter permease [Lachnospiraceae bacterium]
MKKFFIRFGIMLKRTVMQPFYIVMLGVLILLSVIYAMIPVEEKSLYISIALYCEDTSAEAEEFKNALITEQSVFSFYLVESEEKLKEDVVSGKANSGFIIPEDYIHKTGTDGYDKKIKEYTSPRSFLPRIAYEEIYEVMYRYTSNEMIKRQINDKYAYLEIDPYIIDDVYFGYTEQKTIFSTNTEYGEYKELTEETKTDIPIRKLAGLFIYIVAILGTAAYIKDRENNIYLLMSNKEKISLRFIHTLASILPMSVTTYFVMLILREYSPLESFVRLFVYIIAVAVVSLLFGMLFKKSKTFYRFLPVWLVLTLVLSGVLFDLGKYNIFMQYLARLFPPYYF